MHTFKILKSLDTGTARGTNCPDSLFQLTAVNALNDFKSVMGGICKCRLDSIYYPSNNKYVFFVIEVGFDSKADFNKLKLQHDKRAGYLKALHKNYSNMKDSELFEGHIEVVDGGTFS